MFTRIVCSWCRFVNDEREQMCIRCGHETEAPRGRCGCTACAADRLIASLARPATPAEVVTA